MSDEALEKQHQATAKRIADLKKKGNTMRSRDLTSGIVFLAAIVMLFYSIHSIEERFQDNFVVTFTNLKPIVQANQFPAEFLLNLVVNNVLLIMPIYLVTFLMSFLTPFAFGGWNFTLEPIRFKGETFDIFSNLKNIFSKKMVLNVIKSLLKVTLIVSIFIFFCLAHKQVILSLPRLPLLSAVKASYSIAKDFIMMITASLVFIILYDVITNYFEFTHKIKMTTQEVKDEAKDAEGSPEVKRKMRGVQFALLRQRLSLTVPRATVIVTNPTHYAIALRYDPKKDKAPKVVAKGKDYMAAQIRQLAVMHGVPLYQAPVLARAIFKTSKLGSEVNPGLYMAVAIVLSYVHQLKNYQQGHGPQPSYDSDLNVPKEFVFNE